LPQNRHARHRPRTADVVHQTELGIFDLTRAALPSQLGHDLVDHTHAAGADGMAEGLQPATGVDRDITVESSAPFFNELGTFALFGKPEVLIVGDLSPGKTVVHLSDVDLFERVPDAPAEPRVILTPSRRSQTAP